MAARRISAIAWKTTTARSRCECWPTIFLSARRYGSSKSSPRPSDWRSPKVSPVCMRTRTTGRDASPSSGWTASSADWCSTATCARMTSAAIVSGTMGALTRTCTRPSVILAICLTRTITWNCSVVSPHWSHGRPPPCHSGLSAIGLWDSGWIWDAIGGWDGCMGRVSFCLLSAMETCCRANASAPPMRNIMKPQGVLHFSVPVGEDAERRQGGGTFPDYFWVPVGTSWKTRLIGRFPKK